ncbi:MAG: hypothetical protein ABR575_04505, partial [Actinomycetota bacterium]
MRDLEKLLGSALKSVGEAYRPEDVYAARQEFLARRRRRAIGLWAAGGALASATAVVAVLLFAPPAPVKDHDRARLGTPPAQWDAEVSRIPIGDGPLGVTFYDGYVYVVNSREGTVAQVDPVAGEVVDSVVIGGEPDDIAAGPEGIWVTDPPSGTVRLVEFDGSGGRAGEPVEVTEPDTHVDLALGWFGSVWVAAADQEVTRIDPESSSRVPLPEALQAETFYPTDVAADPELGLVLYDSRSGRVQLLGPEPDAGSTGAVAILQGGNDYGDIAAGRGEAWAVEGNDGELFRIAAQSLGTPLKQGLSPVERIPAGFSGLAVGDDGLWVLSGKRDRPGALTKVDSATRRTVGESLELPEACYDIAYGGGSVWVTSYSTDELLRFDLGGGAAPTPAPEHEAELVFVYSAGGDLRAQYSDGSVGTLVATGADEHHPTLSPAGDEIVYQRGNGPRSELYSYDLRTEDSSPLGPGQWPAFAPTGDLAWASPANGALSPPVIYVGRRPHDAASARDTFGNVAAQFPSDDLDDVGAPWTVANLSWDVSGDTLFFNGGWEGYRLFGADILVDRGYRGTYPLPMGGPEEQAGYTFVAPASRAPGDTSVLAGRGRETEGDPFDAIEIGRVVAREDGTHYQPVVPVDADLSLFEASLAVAGNLEVTSEGASRRWVQGTRPAWLVAAADR